MTHHTQNQCKKISIRFLRRQITNWIRYRMMRYHQRLKQSCLTILQFETKKFLGEL